MQGIGSEPMGGLGSKGLGREGWVQSQMGGLGSYGLGREGWVHRFNANGWSGFIRVRKGGLGFTGC